MAAQARRAQIARIDAAADAYMAAHPVDMDYEVADVMVDVGGRRTDSPNFFGHASIAVTGGGIYSFGTDTKLGISVSDFVSNQFQLRDQTLYFIKTTPTQDAKMLQYPGSQQDNIGYFDNCAYRTYSTLQAGGVETLTPMLTPWAVGGNLTILRTLSVYVPRGGTVPDLSPFEH